MKLTDLTNPQKIAGVVLPSMLEQRDGNLMGEVQKQLNERIEKGELTGFDNGAAFIVAVRDAVIAMPGLSSRPDGQESLNLAVQLINTMFQYERVASNDAQLGV